MRKGYWRNRKGKEMKIKDMTSEHIYNCMCFLMGHIVLDPVYNISYTDKQIVERIRNMNKKLTEFSMESKRRDFV